MPHGLRLVAIGAIATGLLGCQHSATAIGSSADPGTAPKPPSRDQLRAEALSKCSTRDDCVMVPIVPDGGHSRCRVAISRDKVGEF